MPSHVIKEITVSKYTDQIHQIMQAAYTVEAQLLKLEDFYPLSRTSQDIATSSNQFIGSFHNGELAGICELEVFTSDSILIASIVVKPTCFRQGIASALIKYVLKTNTKVASIFVSTAENNLPAIKLYQKHGFILHDREVLPDGMKLVKLLFTRGR